MKMSSWIFLMISALMIVGGIFLCNYARAKAPSAEAIDGYTTTEDGQSYTEIDYSYQRVTTVSLSLENCKVEIRGNAKEAKLELIGFKPNSYIGNVTNKTIKVSNQLSLMDYFSLDGTGVSFAGVWRTLFSMVNDQSDEDPQVILYIPEDNDIQQYNLTFNNCTVSMINLVGESDYSLLSTDSTLEINSLGASLADMVCDNSELSIVNSSIDHLIYELNGGSLITNQLSTEDMVFTGEEGEVNLINADFAELSLKMASCDLTVDTIYTQGSFKREITLEKGEVYLGDLLIGSTDISPEGETLPGKMIIALEEGKVVTKYGEKQLVLDEDIPSTSESTTSEPSTVDSDSE